MILLAAIALFSGCVIGEAATASRKDSPPEEIIVRASGCDKPVHDNTNGVLSHFDRFVRDPREKEREIVPQKLPVKFLDGIDECRFVFASFDKQAPWAQKAAAYYKSFAIINGPDLHIYGGVN